MKRFFLLSFLLVILLSCEKKVKSDKSIEGRNLFKESASLMNDYIAAMEMAQDSISLDSLNEDFEKKITTLNFSFPPETDYILNEQENDSLFMLLQRLKEIKDSKLKALAKIKHEEPVDSIEE